MLAKARRIPASVWIISFASLLLTSAAAMSFSVFGLSLEYMGVSKRNIGKIDGILEGFGCCLKMVSGLLSDVFSRRKAIFALGALFTTTAKGIVLLTMSAKGLIGGRVIDRIGNGVQASPRDALVGDYAPPELRGTCFGLRQAMGSLGSVLGAILVAKLFAKYNIEYRTVFKLSFFAGLAAFCLITFCVKDCPRLQRPKDDQAKKSKFRLRDIPHLAPRYWVLMVIVGVFMLGRMSESLIILFAKTKFTLAKTESVRVMLYYNLASVLAAFAAGRMVDRLPPIALLMIGALTTLSANLVMLNAGCFGSFLIGVLLWGVQIGTMQSIFCSEIARLVPFEYRGTGFGIYSLITALSVICANFVCGRLMDSFYAERAFWYGGAISLVTCILVIAFRSMFDQHPREGDSAN